MLFQSGEFVWGFLLPVLVVFYAAARLGGARWALGVLVVASLGFYAWSRPLHLLVLLASIGANYAVADRVIARRGTRAGRAWLAAGVAANVGVLGWFKYAAFFAETVEAATGWRLGLHAVMLPLGVSFFTFQKIAYLMDAWRGKFATQNWADYALFVTFFPQLIAGPIVHRDEFFPQLAGGEFAQWRTERMVGGLAVFVAGVGKKLLLADPLGRDADGMFALLAAGKPVGAIDGWLGVLAYTFQIYFDFSAYSDMAIGLALLCGITLPENFAAPYRATSVIEFWRRWHMTLSRFLRDYVYIPLGGNAGGRWRQAGSLLATMLIGGLWHGAAWTFAAWGALHGAALVANHAWRRNGRRLPAAAGWALTALVVVAGWVLFRSGTFAVAGRAYAALAGANGWWPGGAADGAAWLRAMQPPAEWRELGELLWHLGWTGPVGGTGGEWHHVALGAPVVQAGRIAVAAALVAWGTPAVRWLWNLETGTGRFSRGKACLLAAVLLAAILQGIAVTPSTFIYFRF